MAPLDVPLHVAQRIVPAVRDQGQISESGVVEVLTHLAIGIYYKAGETPLPKITVKGEGAIAAVIKRAAADAGVPIMENVPLAHALYRQATTNQYIPEELIEPVVEVLKWVQSLESARKEEEEDLDSVSLDDE